MDRFPRTVLCCWIELKKKVIYTSQEALSWKSEFCAKEENLLWAEYFTSLGTQWGRLMLLSGTLILNLTSGSFPKCGSGTTKVGCILLPLALIHDSLCVWKISSAGEECVGMGQREASGKVCQDVMCEVVPGYSEARLQRVQLPDLLASASLCAVSNPVIR